MNFAPVYILHRNSILQRMTWSETRPGTLKSGEPRWLFPYDDFGAARLPCDVWGTPLFRRLFDVK